MVNFYEFNFFTTSLPVFIHILNFLFSKTSAQCNNGCNGECAPRNLTAEVSGPGAINFVWLDPLDSLDTVDEYFVYFSTSEIGPWITVEGFLFAQYPAFYDAPPCNTTSEAATCNKGRLQGLTVGIRYYLRVSAGRCCSSFLGTPGCETCLASDYAACPISAYTTTSIVAMGTMIKHSKIATFTWLNLVLFQAYLQLR